MTSSRQLQHTEFPSKTELQNNIWWLSLTVVYLISWLVVYMELSILPRLALTGMLFLFMLKSYRLATLIMILVCLILFYTNLFRGIGVSGVSPLRILFFPFLYLSWIQEKKRSFPVNGTVVIMILLSIVSLKVSSNLRFALQEIPPQFRFEAATPGLFNSIASYFDVIAKLTVIYFAFTRLNNRDIHWLFKGFLLIIFLEAVTIAYLAYQNPETILNYREALNNNRLLWNNPYFGQKNDWGMMFSIVFAISLLKLIKAPNFKAFYTIILIGSLVGLTLSLSRQAYFYVFLSLVILLIGTRNIKLFLFTVFSGLILITTQPAFIWNRLESTLSAESVEDIQTDYGNRKFSTIAIRQVEENMQLIPRMFFTESWEYNWSEGFWNGMLHQLGIIGLMFHLILYFFLSLRYLRFTFSTEKSISTLALLGVLLTILMFLAHFNRQTFHFLHYNGTLTPENFFNLFILTYIEFNIFVSDTSYNVFNSSLGILNSSSNKIYKITS